MRHVVFDLSAAIVLACWSTVGLLWATCARRAPDTQATAAAPRDTLSRLAGAIAIAAVLSPASLWGSMTSDSVLLRAVGGLCLLAATGFTVWARLVLGRRWSSPARAVAPDSLVTRGPYGLTRHPIYTGIIAMLASTALDQGLGRWIAIALAVSLLLVAKARQEERALMRALPTEYGRYRSRVPRLLPRARRRAC